MGTTNGAGSPWKLECENHCKWYKNYLILYRWHHQPRDWVNRFDRSNIKINKLSGYEFWEAHLFGTIIFRVLFCCSHLGRNVSVLACSSVFFFSENLTPSSRRQLWFDRWRERLSSCARFDLVIVSKIFIIVI